MLESIAAWNRYYPVTDKVRQVDWHGGFTAAAGHALYTARTYPRHYWNRAAFVTDPTGHLAATFLIEPRGADFVSHNSWNLAASFDEWTAPIAAEVGPDGQVWLIDWYNYIVQHNPTPQGFETGAGNAYETNLRDKTHGRIYRVVYKPSRPSPINRLDPADESQLVAALASDNLFWRLTAQRLLIERGKQAIVPRLIAMVADEAQDELGLNVGAIHGLWTLAGLGALEPAESPGFRAAAVALRHPSAAVRRNAVCALPRTAEASAALVAAGVTGDAEPQVRLAAFLALGEMPANEASANAVASALVQAANLDDRWLADAMTAAAARNDLRVLEAIARQPPPRQPRFRQITARVAEHLGREGNVEKVAPLLAALSEAQPAVCEAIVLGIAKGWPKDHPVSLGGESERRLVALVARVSPAARGPLVALGQRWGSNRLKDYAEQLAQAWLQVVNDSAQADIARVSAARQWVEFDKAARGPIDKILAQVSPRVSAELAAGLIEAVGGSESPETGTLLVESLASVTPAVRPVILRVLLSRTAWTGSLLDTIEAGRAQFGELSLEQQQSLLGHPDPKTAQRAKRLLALGGGLPDADRQKVIEQLSRQVLAGGNAERGRAVFKEHCAKCHVHSGEGVNVGPDLTGMAVHPKQELLVHVLDPSRSVEGNYLQYTVLTDDGRSLSGLLASETKTAVELIAVDGKRQTLLRENIEELAATKKSLMPEGFEKQVTPAALADLLEFLTRRGRFLPLDLRKAATAVSTRGMFYDEQALAERLVFDDWSPKNVNGVPFQLVDPQGDRTRNVVLLYGPHGKLPPTMPKTVTLACNSPAVAIHLLSGVSGWGYAGGQVKPTVSMIVRLHYADGTSEDHPLENGVHFADYIRPVDVPGSRLAFQLRGQQIRYLSVEPRRGETIASIELVKGPDNTAPVVMAVTVETRREE